MLTAFTRPAIVAVAVYLVGFGTYQLALAAGTHEVLEFSEKLVDALEADQAVKQHRGLIVLVPGDPAAERLLHGSIGGYLDIVVKVALARPDLQGAVAYAGEPAPDGLRLRCGYRDGAVILSRPNPCTADGYRASSGSPNAMMFDPAATATYCLLSNM